MRVLAVDTSLEACAVGIATTGDYPRGAVVRSELLGRGHAERLFGMIGEALAEAGIALRDIDRFAVTVGPGSFTGIRVGIAAMRGFALATGKPALGVSTLAVYAAAARALAGGSAVLVALPGKGGDVFAQLFEADGAARSAAVNAQPEAIVAEAAAVGAVIVGGAAGSVAAVWPSPAVPRIVPSDPVPDMRAFLRLALAAPDPTEPPRPLYLRAPDAVPSAAPALLRR